MWESIITDNATVSGQCDFYNTVVTEKSRRTPGEASLTYHFNLNRGVSFEKPGYPSTAVISHSIQTRRRRPLDVAAKYRGVSELLTSWSSARIPRRPYLPTFLASLPHQAEITARLYLSHRSPYRSHRFFIKSKVILLSLHICHKQLIKIKFIK